MYLKDMYAIEYTYVAMLRLQYNCTQYEEDHQ